MSLFKHGWLERSLVALRLGGEVITTWLKSNQQGESQLFRGQSLEDTQAAE